MKVTYLYHSGYLVETESAILLFDYFKGGLPAFPAHKPLIVFASHKHPDHFDFRIFDLKTHPGSTYYVFGSDIRFSDGYLERKGIDPRIKEQIHRLSSHKELDIPMQGGESLKIRTLKSTDEGVAFYVKDGNERIYHAGDLNWWHWEGEAESFNATQEKVYKEEIGLLQSWLKEEESSLDAAFVPLDPRLQNAYCYGMDTFLSSIPVKKVYPMHMWEDYDVIERYLAHCKAKEEKQSWIPLIQNPVSNENSR